MAERNLIAEGFIRNTLNEAGSVSGTQIVSIPEMNALIDEDFSTTAVTVTGSFFISLDADLGARWKLNRIELYTDEPNSLNFDMSVSVNNSDFFPITMTGSAGLWVGSVSGTTVSGAPRYLRFEQRAPTDRLTQEWRAINDDTLVDFGETGSQTEVEIEDAPIGRPSDAVTELRLFNKFDKTAQGFVFIGSTGDKGDDNIEISLSPSGPWFGKQTQGARQPETLNWVEFSEASEVSVYRRTQPDRVANQNQPTGAFSGQLQQGIVQNLRVVSGTAYRTDFSSGLAKGWTTSGFSTESITAGSQVGNSSTSVNPKYILPQTFGTTAATSPDSAPTISNGFVPFRAEAYDTVEIKLSNPGTIPYSDLVEGPRFFWKTHHMLAFDTEHSKLSTTPNQLGTGNTQTFMFDMTNVPTWSGVIVGLQIQPWLTATGIGFSGLHNSTEIYQSGIGKADRLALDFDSVISGTFTSLFLGTGTTAANAWRIVVNTENVIKEPCIITSLTIPVKHSDRTTFDQEGWFLCRFRDGFAYQDRATEVNQAVADPFIVKQVAVLPAHHNLTQILSERMPVYWPAEPGDMIGYGFRQSFITSGPQFRFETGTLTTTTGGGLANASFMDIRTTSALQTDMNASTAWFITAVKPNVQFKAISAGKYLGTGAYTTPIFDGGGDPALLSFEFDSVQENGTTIDVDGSATSNTIFTRASSTPPNTSVNLGFRKRQFMLGAHPSDMPSRFDPKYESNYVIGLMNAEVEARQTAVNQAGDTQIENMGASLFYHEVNQELWILNINISGTVNTDMRPVWDVYDVTEGGPPEYLRTQHVSGSIAYTYNNNSQSADDVFIFEPVGWQADYNREEIYVISREDCFSVGNGTYNGLILTLDGEYKDVFWRNSQLTQDIVDGGFETTTANADRHLINMRTVVYRAPYFYALTSPVANSDDGTHITVYRLGNNPLDPDNANDVEFITEVDLGTVAGLTTITDSSPADTLTYCSANDLFYFIKDDGDAIFTFRAAITGIVPNESVVITAGPVQQTSPQLFALQSLVEAFSFTVALQPTNPWEGSGLVQQLKPMIDLTYDKDRDSFWHLLNYRSNHTQDFVREGQFNLSDFFWHFHNHSVLVEYGASTRGVIVDTPRYSNQIDPTWGTLSGTLSYEQVAENSVLFPTGRYAQLKYQLNADPARQATPYLISSRVNQGIRVTNIPASGTKSLYLRTNIPDTETIGDQSGRLKVFWELDGS